MFVGGTDTTATTMEWAMAELVKNPSVMKNAQEEARRVVGEKSRVDEADIDQMDYLKVYCQRNSEITRSCYGYSRIICMCQTGRL
jgi:cytochrome P450